MAEGLTPDSILRQYQAASDIVQQQRSKMAEQTADASTFAGRLESKIAQREISPEARKREKEVIGELFGAPEEIRKRMEGTQLLPTEVGSLTANRVNTYLDQLDSIRDSRNARQERIDNIVKNAAVGVQAEADINRANYDAAVDARNEAWTLYKEAIRQIEHQESLRSAGTLAERELSIQNDIRQKFNDIEVEEAKNPNWDQYWDPYKYISLLNEAESNLGEDGKEWFLRKYPPSQYILPNNFGILEQSGIDLQKIAINMSDKELRLQLGDDIKKASLDNIMDVLNFYGDLMKLSGTSDTVFENRGYIERKLIEKFGEIEGIRIADEFLPDIRSYTTYESGE